MGYPTPPMQQTPFAQQPPPPVPAFGMQQPAYGMQQQPQPAYGMPLQGGSAITSVPLTLSKQGGRFLFPDAYSLELNGKLTRDEFSAIVAELNATALEHGPNMGGWRMALAMIPCTGMCTLLTWRAQLDNLKGELQRTCVDINARNAALGSKRLNLLYREVLYGGGGYSNGNGYGYSHYRPGEMMSQIEVQVLG